MQHLLTHTRNVLLATVLVSAFLFAYHGVHAQNTPATTFKTPTGTALLDYFNPDKNPTLKAANLKYIPTSKPTEAPHAVPNYGSLCKIYGLTTLGGGTVTACLQPDGSFTMYAADGTPTDLKSAISASNTNSPDAVATSPTGKTSDLASAVQGVPPAAASDTNGCTFGPGGNLRSCLESIMFWIIKKIGLFFLFLAATFAGIAGLLLNWVVYITVFQFGNLIGNNPGLLAAWGVLRDIGNLILLFGFIFMGISTILSLPGNEFTARKALPGLIIFAILMNFSLFAAEAVIDTSNAIGTTLYRQAGQGTCPESADFKQCATNYGISGSVFKVSGISAIFNFDGDKQADVVGNDLAAVIEILGLTVFAAVAAFVFFAAVFLFITRCVVLAFLMVISPIGFAGMAIPPLHEMASQWWSGLLKQSFFAPIYILLILVSLKVMEGVTVALDTASGGGGVANLASAFKASGASNVSMMVNFFLITGFMLASLIMAQRFGAIGAERATKAAGGVVFGGMARVSNIAVGGSARLARTGVQRLPFARRLTPLVSGLRGLEKANLDIRRVGVGAALAGAGLTNAAKPVEHASFTDTEHALHDVGTKLRADQALNEREIARSRLLSESHGQATLSAPVRDTLQSMSEKELVALHGIKEGVEVLARELTDTQFDGLMRSNDLTDDEKRGIRTARDSRFNATFAASTLSTMRPNQVAALTGSTLSSAPVVAAMSGRQMAAIDPSSLTPAQLAPIQARILADRASAAAAGTTSEFDMLYTGGPGGAAANPTVRNRWNGYGV